MSGNFYKLSDVNSWLKRRFTVFWLSGRDYFFPSKIKNENNVNIGILKWKLKMRDKE